MVYTLEDIKKKRNNPDAGLEKAKKTLDQFKSNDRNNNNDDRFWSPTYENGVAQATIRFLEPPQESETNQTGYFVKFYTHFMQSPTTGKYLKCNSLTTLGKDCPISDYNSHLWSLGDAGQKVVSFGEFPNRNQEKKFPWKRKGFNIANILVVKDHANPENNGKVFLYRFPYKMLEMIESMLEPSIEGKERVDIFNPFSGHNLHIHAVLKKITGFSQPKPNFDKCEWAMSSSPIAETDEEIVRIMNETHSLWEFQDPKKFSSYSELKSDLDKFLGYDTSIRDGSNEVWLTGKPVIRQETKQADFAMEQAVDNDVNVDDALEAFLQETVNKDSDDPLPV